MAPFLLLKREWGVMCGVCVRECRTHTQHISILAQKSLFTSFFCFHPLCVTRRKRTTKKKTSKHHPAHFEPHIPPSNNQKSCLRTETLPTLFSFGSLVFFLSVFFFPLSWSPFRSSLIFKETKKLSFLDSQSHPLSKNLEADREKKTSKTEVLLFFLLGKSFSDRYARRKFLHFFLLFGYERLTLFFFTLSPWKTRKKREKKKKE